MAANNPNAAYWQKRFKAIENQANLTGADSLSYITAQYQQAAKEIEAQISTWYVQKQRYFHARSETSPCRF